MTTQDILQGKTILAVDDEPDILEALADELDMCRVIGKTTYEDALDALDTESPDLVILDIMGVKGFELLKACTERGLPAVMLTAHAFNLEALKKSLDLGARGFFPKERIAELPAFLNEVLGKDVEASWQHLFERLGEFFNATFGVDWKKHFIETGPFVVPR